MKVQDIRRKFCYQLLSQNFVIDKTGVKTIEIVGASFIADERQIFGTVDDDWNKRELEWYLSQRLNIDEIPPPVPKLWKNCAAKDGKINSNYGWMVFSPQNESQYQKCLNELIVNPFSRRAVMIYTRPRMWVEYNENGMSDFTCTNVVQYLIRNNRLECVVQMRSNDMIYGYKGDLHWQKYVHQKLAVDLGVAVGDIHWQVGSAHIYEKHFHLVEEWFHATNPS